ncbi:sigma-70 family RNA polymerase sigma factor [Parapedobacter sp. ISTM3]|uniref:RNA polymerase sigma factor n=1 Tax=Parapedobacter sp. ISTM3 TaxID=2800130 RepID=UPI001904F0FE|nr:sigma-70 family RNA polymerase sigma factor [Parapedobacter sp. ISTM3]MBK1438886.1 sigma-70 family RNA polymerase sigma factor [Parapedobacter sp. ISTM3]
MDSPAQEAKLFRFTEENYTTIFNSYWRKLYTIAYRRLRDTELAKDMVQEVFVYCWQQREAIRITTSVEAYLRSALQYQLVAHFRKLDINDRAFAYLYERMVEVEAHMRDMLTEQDLAKTLNTELELMPDTMREIFKLRIRDYTVVEIAQSLNLAEKTVRNNIAKGLHRLRNAVSKDFPEDFSAICLSLYVLLT